MKCRISPDAYDRYIFIKHSVDTAGNHYLILVVLLFEDYYERNAKLGAKFVLK